MFDNAPVSIDTSPVTNTDQVSLDTGTTVPEMTPERADKLAFKTEFGLPNSKKTYDAIYTSLVSGQEDQVRRELAVNEDAIKGAKVQQQVTKLLGSGVTPDYHSPEVVTQAIKLAQGKPTDPDAVIENGYGYQYLAQLDRTSAKNPFSIYAQMNVQYPELTEAVKQGGGTLVAQRSAAEDVLEVAEKRAKEQSWLGVIADTAKFLNPLYQDMKLRGLVNDRWFSGFGTNLLDTEVENQISQLNTIMDVGEYKRQLSAIVQRIGDDNPTLAVKIAKAAVGRSTDDVRMDNLFNAIDLFTLGQLGEAVGRGVYNAGKTAALKSAATKYAKDVIRSSESTEPPKVAMAQGSGDIEEAGVQKATDTAVKLETGRADQKNVAADTLLSTHRLDQIATTTDRAPPPVQSGFTRFYFGGDATSPTKIVHQSFDEATNFGASTSVRYVDIPKDSPLLGTEKNLFRGKDNVAQVTKDLEAFQEKLPTLVGGAKTNVERQIKERQEYLNKAAEKTTVELPSEMQIGLIPYETRPATSRNYRELTTNLLNQYDHYSEAFKKVFAKVLDVEKIPALVKTEAAMRLVTNDLKTSMPGLDNHVIDIPPPVKGAGNWYDYSMHIGQSGARHFEGYHEAEAFAKLKNLSDYTIEGEGLNWYIKITRPLPLNSDIVRDGLLATKNARSPELGDIGSYFADKRTPDDIFSAEHVENRKAAVYSAALWKELAKTQRKYIEDLARGKVNGPMLPDEEFFRAPKLGLIERRQRLKEWNRAVEAAKTYDNPVTGKPGYWFKSPGELEDFYLKTFKRLPDDVEIHAYFANKILTEQDHQLRNLRVVTNMKQQGAVTHSFFVRNDAGELIKSPEFDGVRVNKLPTGNATVLEIAEHIEDSKVSILNLSGPKFTQSARKAIESGEQQMVRILHPERSPLAALGLGEDTRNVVYVLAKTFETKPISWEQVPRQEGGHFVYEAEHYIKQANVVKEKVGNVFRRLYLGDNTVMPMQVRAMAGDVAIKLDNYRQLLALKKDAEATAYLKANPIGVDAEEVRSWFEPQKHRETGILYPAKLNKDEKIQVVRRNNNIWDETDALRQAYPKGGIGAIEDARKFSLGNQYAVEFTGERDANGLKTIVNEGTATNPLYKHVDAPYVDPITVLNRSLNRIVNSTFMDDYKTFAIEHWLQEAAVHHKVMKDSLPQIRSSPYHFFHSGEFKPDADANTVNQLKAQREAIKSLLGQPSTWDATVQSIGDKLTDSLYNGVRIGVGPVAVTATLGPKTAKFLSNYAIPFAKDPSSFFRTVAFHEALGMFALPQIFAQSASYSAMYAIAGARPAGAGSAAATFRIWDALNPLHRAHLDAALAKMQMGDGKYWWRPGQFTEATELMERTGYHLVEDEHALVNNQLLSTNVIRNGLQEFLDLGQTFRRLGDLNTRHGSWYMAYMEYRAENPVGRITDTALREIVNRADLLAGNMSRASSSSIHKGIFSPATQFLAYQIRQTEQVLSGGLLGKSGRLTPYEKMRLYGVNAALYGVPIATGVGGIPLVGDKLREAVIEKLGYVPGAHAWSTAVMEGLPALIGGLISGRGDLQAGTVYNFGPRYGNPGFEPIREAFRTDPNVLKMVGGAPFGKLANTLKSMDPFWNSVVNLFNDSHPINENDILDIMNEVSGISLPRRMIAAANSGRILSNRGTYLDEASPLKAAFMALTGLQNVRITDQQHNREILESVETLQKDATRGFSREYQRYLIALSNKDDAAADNAHRRSTYYLQIGGLPQFRANQILKSVLDANKSLIQKIDWKLYGDPKNIPEGQRDLRQQTYETIQNMNKAQGKEDF